MYLSFSSFSGSPVWSFIFNFVELSPPFLIRILPMYPSVAVIVPVTVAPLTVKMPSFVKANLSLALNVLSVSL
jgi:hypothetical protein